MAWNYVPPGEYTDGYWVDNSTPGYPLISYTDPTKGFANQSSALESLYIPTAGNRMDQVQSLIAQKPDEYAKYGITPQNASDMVNSTFYDRINNIDNDPLSFLNNLAFLPHMAGLANVFTGGGVDSFLSKYLGEPASVSVQSGGMPTQVGGWSWTDPSLTQGGGMDWLNTDWGTEGLVNNGIETMPFTTDPRFAGTTVDFTTSKVGGLNMNDYYSMLDDIQAGTNGVTAPSPTMSIPGYGDIYGPMGNILKNVNNIPGLSQLLRGASSGNTSALDAIKKIFSGNGSWSDGLSALGGIAPSLLGMYASNQQTNALKDLANKYSEYGAPYRSQLAEISADPNKFYNSTAAQKGVDTVLNKLSIGGNPSGSPYKQQLAVDSLWNDYGKERDRLAGFGGLTNYNAAAPSLDAQAVNSQGNMYNALGAGLNDIFNPKTSLADLLKQGKVV